MKKDYEAIDRCKSDANNAKDKLISIMQELEELGAKRESKSLETIIIKLETWQNK